VLARRINDPQPLPEPESLTEEDDQGLYTTRTAGRDES
jgi:hypothetical protein